MPRRQAHRLDRCERPSRVHPNAPGRPDHRGALGRRGETLALEHLRRLGYDLLERNHRRRCGEIDLIVQRRDVLVFVEVKTRLLPAASQPASRSAELASTPLLGLRAQQRRRIRRTAAAWLRERPGPPRAVDLRFDAIGIVLDRSARLVALDHVEGIA